MIEPNVSTTPPDSAYRVPSIRFFSTGDFSTRSADGGLMDGTSSSGSSKVTLDLEGERAIRFRVPKEGFVIFFGASTRETLDSFLVGTVKFGTEGTCAKIADEIACS